MSILFISLLIVGLFGFHLHRRAGLKDDFSLLFMVVVALALAACSKAEPHTLSGHVDYGVSYDHGYMLLDVDVQGDEAVRELTLTWDAPITSSDMVDLCVQVQPQGEGIAYTWFYLPDSEHNRCLLQDPGTTPLTTGKYTMTLEFKLHRSVLADEAALDHWVTPKLLSCKVSK